MAGNRNVWRELVPGTCPRKPVSSLSTQVLKPGVDGVDTGNKREKMKMKNVYARGRMEIERSEKSGRQGPARGRTNLGKPGAPGPA